MTKQSDKLEKEIEHLLNSRTTTASVEDMRKLANRIGAKQCKLLKLTQKLPVWQLTQINQEYK